MRLRSRRPVLAAPTPSPCCRTPRRLACLTPSHAASRATRSLCFLKSRTLPVSPIRPPAPARSKRSPKSSVRRRGPSFRRSKKPAAPGPRSNPALVQKNVAAIRAEREKAVARGKDILTGTNAYPDIREATPAVLDVAPAAKIEPASAAALPRIRLGEPFEKLRDKSDAILAKTGARPKIFLAVLGKPADFSARANFAKNFFEAGGIETIEGVAGSRSPPRSRRRARRSPVCAAPTRPTKPKPPARRPP